MEENHTIFAYIEVVILQQQVEVRVTKTHWELQPIFVANIDAHPHTSLLTDKKGLSYFVHEESVGQDALVEPIAIQTEQLQNKRIQKSSKLTEKRILAHVCRHRSQRRT